MRTHTRTHTPSHERKHARIHAPMLAGTHAPTHNSLSHYLPLLSSYLRYWCTTTVDELQLFCCGVVISLLSRCQRYRLVSRTTTKSHNCLRRHQPMSTNVTLFEYYSYNLRRGVTSQDYRYLIYHFKICVLPLTYSMWIHFHDTNITSTR